MSQGRYVWIAGKKVYLNSELQKERDKLINKERYRLHQMLKYITINEQIPKGNQKDRDISSLWW